MRCIMQSGASSSSINEKVEMTLINHIQSYNGVPGSLQLNSDKNFYYIILLYRGESSSFPDDVLIRIFTVHKRVLTLIDTLYEYPFDTRYPNPACDPTYNSDSDIIYTGEGFGEMNSYQSELFIMTLNTSKLIYNKLITLDTAHLNESIESIVTQNDIK